MPLCALCSQRFQDHAALFRSKKFGLSPKLSQVEGGACTGDRRSVATAGFVRLGVSELLQHMGIVWDLFGGTGGSMERALGLCRS